MNLSLNLLSMIKAFGWMLVTSTSFALVLTFFMGDWGFLWACVLAGFIGSKSTSKPIEGLIAGSMAGIVFSLLFGIAITSKIYWRTFPTVLGNFIDPIIGLGIAAIFIMSAFGSLGAVLWYRGGIEPSTVSPSQIRFYCPVCGKILSPGDIFCRNCGVKLDELEDDESVQDPLSLRDFITE